MDVKLLNYANVIPNTERARYGKEGSERKKQELLDKLLPPREWIDDKQKAWCQPVSSQPATEKDVTELEKNLYIQLSESEALPVGICLAREEIYTDLFNEVVRQVTVDCGERGILLNKVKLDISARVESLKKLYESSIKFGIRKSISIETRKKDLSSRKETLLAAIETKKTDLETITSKYKDVRDATAAEMKKLEEDHKSQVTELEQMNKKLKQNLEALAAPPAEEEEDEHEEGKED